MQLFPNENYLRSLPFDTDKRANPTQARRRKAYEDKVGHPITWSESRCPLVWSKKAIPSSPAEMQAFGSRLLGILANDTDLGNELIGWMSADGDSVMRGSTYNLKQGGANIVAMTNLMDQLQLPHSLLRLEVYRNIRTAGAVLDGDGIHQTNAKDGFEYKVILNLGMFPAAARYLDSLDPKNITLHWERPGFLRTFFSGDGCQSQLAARNGVNVQVSQRVAKKYAEAFAKKFGGTIPPGALRRNEPTPTVYWTSHAESATFLNHIYDGVTDNTLTHPIKLADYRAAKGEIERVLTKGRAKSRQSPAIRVQQGIGSTVTLENEDARVGGRSERTHS